MPKQPSGFTLIELVVVIVILGLLAATALPRFISVTTNAREAKMQGLAGAMSSAASLAHSAQLTAQAASNASVSMEGATVTMVNGYPTADATGIQVAANISATDFNIIGGTPYAVAPDTGHASCTTTYLAATATTAPVVDKSNIIDANCS